MHGAWSRLRGLCDHSAPGSPHGVVDLDSDEQATLSALAEQGLVPPLRLIPGVRPARSVSPLPGRQDYA
jgi:hypothetical protein